MTIEQYSTVLSVSILLLGATTFLSIISYFSSSRIRERFSTVTYDTWLKLIGIFATIATLGALTYQFIYLTPVCLDCWWQRIFMFPLEIIVITSLLTKNKLNHYLIGFMATVGALFSIDHYSEHFERYVLGSPSLEPCSPILTDPLCGLAPTVTFGFITIPFMALITFVTIIWISYLAFQKIRRVENTPEETH